MSGVTVTVDTRGFEAMVRDLSRISGKTFKETLRDRAANLLSIAIKYTPVSDKTKATEKAARQLTAKFHTFAPDLAGNADQTVAGKRFSSAKGQQPRISIAPRKGNDWWRQNGRWYRMNDPKRRHNDAMWAQYKAMDAQREATVQREKRDAAKRIGRSTSLSRRSWIDIGDSLGLTAQMKFPKVASRATTASGRTYVNGRGNEAYNGAKAVITLINTAPTLTGNKGQGARILQRAISTTISAFEQALKHDVFSDAKARAARYPGLFVSST